APLFLLALVAWIERGLPRPTRAVAVCAVVAAALPGMLPFHHLISVSAESDTLALLPLWWLQEGVASLSTISAIVVAGSIALALWENEFFNRSIGSVYDLRGPSMGNFPETKLERRDGLLLASGRPVRHRYVLTDTTVPLVGTPVASDTRKGMVLLRTDGSLRL